MGVRIRMKRMGRRHRPFFRICATDSRRPRDGRVLEVIGTYDPMVPDTDARVVWNLERLQYWLSVGAQPTEKVKVLIKKYGPNGTHLEQQKEALERLAEQRRRQPLQILPKKKASAAKLAEASEENAD
ncbi:MAG: 30S ribosomal protein S16 [Thermoguttaceae bacterium]|nr:30S ribosomal protein S16 [Thermoguttaceae bacterium]MDW8039682.1 30S ribosomal protein S16 [Thermoguttaceae bacterium]